MTGTHHDAHLVSQGPVLAIINIELRCPHGEPEVVRLRAEQQLEHVYVKLAVVYSPILLLDLVRERRLLMVDEKTSIF